MTKIKLNFYSLILLLCFLLPVYFSLAVSVLAQNSADWYMLGANPQRTSWVSEEVGGQLYPMWYTPFVPDANNNVPFVNCKIQVITANGLLYISTSRGLYALSATSGNVAWVYPTQIPLGHSPTVIGSTLYVGSYDKRIHAIQANPDVNSLATDSATGQKINNKIVWLSDSAEAGFETNPLVVNGMVYAGSRDGYFYAFNASTGKTAWKYKAGGPILFSAAISTDNTTLYFAANDTSAYAVNASNGSLVWKSVKLPGAGFHSFWPVVYGDYVVFTSSLHYVFGVPDQEQFQNLEYEYTYSGIPAGGYIGSRNTGDTSWVSGRTSTTIDMTKAIDYLKQKPERRHYFLLNRATGVEYTFNGNYPPILWTGTHSGNKYPPAVGKDGILYQSNHYRANDFDPRYISAGHISGWKLGATRISQVLDGLSNNDEPEGLALGGNRIYYMQWFGNDGGSGSYAGNGPSSISYYLQYNFQSKFQGITGRPGYEVYTHTNPAPPIPYQGKVYSNNYQIENQYVGIVGWGSSGSGPRNTPAKVINVQDSGTRVFSDTELKQKLAAELQKMISAGHLRPGYHAQGLSDSYDSSSYFANPSETFIALGQAWEVLKDDANYATLISQLKSYLQSEYQNYAPQSYEHIGRNTGAKREVYDTMPEIQAEMNSNSTMAKNSGYWSNNCYALWKYAQMGLASASSMRSTCKLSSNTADYNVYPYALNRDIAGYIGYCKLEELANSGGNLNGMPTSCSVQSTLNSLLSSRSSIWGTSNSGDGTLDGARHFMNLVPELGEYLSSNTSAKNTYELFNKVIPYWFVSKYDSTSGEGVHQKLYDYWALFQAKAYIMKASRAELSKYLDVPAFERGDLYYIQNLAATLKTAYSGPEPSPSPLASCQANVNNDSQVDVNDFKQVLSNWLKTVGFGANDINGDNKVNGIDLVWVIKEWGKSCL